MLVFHLLQLSSIRKSLTAHSTWRDQVAPLSLDEFASDFLAVFSHINSVIKTSEELKKPPIRICANCAYYQLITISSKLTNQA